MCATTFVRSAERSTDAVGVGTSRRAPKANSPINWNLDRPVLGFFGIGSDRSPPATRQATTRSASRACFDTQQDPGVANGVTWNRVTLATACAYNSTYRQFGAQIHPA